MAVVRGEGVNAVFSEQSAHLATGGVSNDPLGLQHGPQEVLSPQVVLQGPGGAGLDDAVADQLCIQRLQAAVGLHISNSTTAAIWHKL